MAIEEAAARLARGELVAFPTETVYGLGADASSGPAVAAIYRVKGRPADHPLIVHVADAAQAQWWGELGAQGLALAQAFWPGPLTLIVRRSAQAPGFACGGEPTVGLRCPAHPVALALLRAFARLGGHGVAAPSANRFGRVSPTRAAHVAADLAAHAAGALGLVLDGGPCEVGLESTIVDLSRGAPVLMRPGGVAADRIERVLGCPLLPRDAQAPRASGTLAAHYAPRTPVELVDGDALAARLAELAGQGRRAAAWCRHRPDAPGSAHWEQAEDDPALFARDLYDGLRRLDALGLDRILVERLPAGAAWDAVRDRLERAAATFAGSA
ncbi:L-threonylcarbamoyladenylate synthase [Quisquiliibacterium transsilvanicum]|nr:L-threonylcarbamoyladenylate synthase [Quisquiliibacterium transsilvanicum]